MRASIPAADKSLRQMNVFRDLPRESLAKVELQCSWQTFPARSQIIHYRDTSNDVYFIDRGMVRAELHSVHGKAVTFRDLGAGDMFGELAAIDGQRRSATIQALSNSLIAQLPARHLWDLLESEPAVMRAVLLHLNRLVRSLSTRVYEFSALAVQNRIHAELLRIARDGAVSGPEVTIARMPTHAEIASRISTHREAVARELSRLAKLGVITRKGAGSTIPDLDRLARMVAEATAE